jgi:superfamily II DNA or RNA helicase
MELRPYQLAARDEVVKAFTADDLHSVLYALPTGTGKTVTFGAIHNALQAERPGKTLVLAHREELLDQAAGMFERSAPGTVVGIEQGDRYAEKDCSVVIASVQTLSRGKRLGWFSPNLIITDEAHHAVAESYVKIFKRYGAMQPGEVKLVGCTATPKRLDKLNLASVFQRQVYNYPIRQAIEEGYLCDIRGYRVRSDVNLDKVKTLGGDFNQGELAAAVMDQNRTRKALSHWWSVARNRQTVVFCASVEHAEMVAETFRSKNFKAECIHGNLGKEERRAILERFKQGETQILTNVEVLTEGFDHPPLSCVLMMRPTKSWSLYMQMTGRGTRICDGKEDLIVIDVVDNCRKHSLAGVPAILDLPPGLDLQGKSLSQAAKYMDQVESKLSLLKEEMPSTFSELQTVLEKVDLFAAVEPAAEVKENSTMTWVKINAEHYLLSCGSVRTDDPAVRGPQQEAHLRQDLMGQWVLQFLVGGVVVDGRGPYDQEIGPVLRIADREVRAYWPSVGYIADSGARWRKDPPTEGQIKMLVRSGFNPDAVSKLTKGEASSMISAVLANR